MIKTIIPPISDLIVLFPEESLKIVTNSDIIDKEVALASMFIDMRKTKIEKIHNYKIWQSSNDGRWRTYIGGTDGIPRKMIAVKSEAALFQALAEHYHILDVASKTTMETLFPEWLQYKAKHTNAAKTILHHSSDWRAYYAGTEITKVPIPKLTRLMLDEWIHDLIRSKNLTTKQYANIACIVNQLLDYAVDRDIIRTNPFRTVKVQRRLLVTPLKKEASSQVYNEDELGALLSEAKKDFDATGDTSSLAIILCAKTGIRIGECMALKGSDFSNGYLLIRREEIINSELLSNGEFGPRTYTVVEHCKTDAGLRDIPVVEEVDDVIKAVLKANLTRGIDNEFLFVKRDGSKMHARSVDTKIRTLCKRAGIPPRSAHKLRKTFISTLLDANMNLDTVRRIAGHKDEKVTLSNYYYDRSTPDDIRMQLENALK